MLTPSAGNIAEVVEEAHMQPMIDTRMLCLRIVDSSSVNVDRVPNSWPVDFCKVCSREPTMNGKCRRQCTWLTHHVIFESNTIQGRRRTVDQYPSRLSLYIMILTYSTYTTVGSRW